MKDHLSLTNTLAAIAILTLSRKAADSQVADEIVRGIVQQAIHTDRVGSLDGPHVQVFRQAAEGDVEPLRKLLDRQPLSKFRLIKGLQANPDDANALEFESAALMVPRSTKLTELLHKAAELM